MKILFITRMYPNEYRSRNGAVIFRQANELIKLGHEVVVVSPTPYVPKIIKGFRPEWLEYSKLPTQTNENNINIYRPRFIDFPTNKFNRYLWKSIETSILSTINNIYINFEFDLIHAHMGYPEGKVAEKIKKIYKVPLITTVRSTDIEKYSTDKKIVQYLKSTLHNTDIVIAPSVPLKRKIKNIINREIRVIGNGTDLINKVELDQYLNNKYKDKTLLLSVSQLTGNKGISTNIKAVKKLIPKIPNIYYIIVGAGPEISELKKLVEKLKVQGYVEFKGNLRHEDAMKYMSVCDVFSLPSLRETFGLVYIEAMLNKKPVILCEDEGIEGTVVHKENGMVIKKNSVEELVNAIYYLYTNQKESKEIAIKGQEVVMKNFLWEKIGKEIEEIYKEVL